MFIVDHSNYLKFTRLGITHHIW